MKFNGSRRRKEADKRVILPGIRLRTYVGGYGMRFFTRV